MVCSGHRHLTRLTSRVDCCQVKDMGESLDRLEKRCKGIIKGSTSYKDTIQGLSTSQIGFCRCLGAFLRWD